MTSADAHKGHGDATPWKVCEDKALAQKCSWEDATHALYRGSCREMGGALVCVRNEPIVRLDAAATAQDASSCRHIAATSAPLDVTTAMVAGLLAGVLFLGWRRQRPALDATRP